LSKSDKAIHVVEIITNKASVPYFNWFADRASEAPDMCFTFVCLNDSEPHMKADMLSRNCNFHWIRFNQNKRKRNYILAIFRMYKLFKKIKPDIVHTHLFDDGLPGMIAAWLAGVKTRVHTKQSTGFHWYYARKMIPFDRLINRLATDLVAVSEECREFIIEKEKAKPNKVSLIHHGIDLNHLTEYNQSDQNDLIEMYHLNGKKVALMLARYIDWKGYKNAIRAAELLKSDCPDLVFLGVGAGEQQSELQDQIIKAGLENRFILTGWIQKKYIPALLNLSDIFVHAASREPFGFVFSGSND
jgi:glycosyltransferase involved in cell wall biosynthesis